MSSKTDTKQRTEEVTVADDILNMHKPIFQKLDSKDEFVQSVQRVLSDKEKQQHQKDIARHSFMLKLNDIYENFTIVFIGLILATTILTLITPYASVLFIFVILFFLLRKNLMLNFDKYRTLPITLKQNGGKRSCVYCHSILFKKITNDADEADNKDKPAKYYCYACDKPLFYKK